MNSLRRIAPVLVCFAAMAVASDVYASIQVPEFIMELPANDVSSAAQKSGAASSDTSSRQTHHTPVPSPPINEVKRLGLAAYVGLTGSGAPSSTAGGSAPSSGSSSNTLAVASTNSFHVDDTLIGFLRESRWLDIPMPPGISLLRPPQAV